MSDHSAETNDEQEKQHTAQAWLRFQEKVKNEPVSQVWLEVEMKAAAMAAESDIRPVQENKQSPAFFLLAKAKYMMAAAAACLMIIILTTGWGDKAIAAMLQTFRVQHLAGVNVSEGDLVKLQAALQQGTDDGISFDLNKYGYVEKFGGGPSLEQTAEKAAERLGAPVRLFPGMDAKQQKVTYEPGLVMKLSLNSAEINKLVARLGGKSKFPSTADGQPITVQLPAVVHSSIVDSDGGIKKLVQLEIPRIDVPNGVDVDQVKKAILDLPFLPEDIHNQLESTSDWTRTLLIPNFSGESTNFLLNGHEAVLNSNESHRSLVWLEGDSIYRLSGATDVYATNEMILADAKEIMNP